MNSISTVFHGSKPKYPPTMYERIADTKLDDNADAGLPHASPAFAKCSKNRQLLLVFA